MSETASNKELHIFDICGHGFPKFHTTFGVKRHNHLSIEVACDGAHRQRSDTIGQGSEPQWSQTFVFGDPSGSVSIRLFIKHAFSGGEFIGEIQEEVAKLALGSTTVNNGVDGGQRTEPQPLRNFTGDGPTPSISFRYFFSAKTSLNVAGLDEMQRAKEAAEKAIVKFNTATENLDSSGSRYGESASDNRSSPGAP
ncbi:hypothetical protein SISNIDRAFT_298765 [Sistotremastrum niveocremeum HHB9708]|uniref:C2 domain-containing protein n=2 Tax=Sistotremastraceae TaxID=3402574 RepID=A0A164NIC4_9AGAM|nr:hypothetical protein SISNIDRAFT_298765 [Sistotremastrum niveocremeum HHB9708]KZT35366.1 hypothetical protein SISSUDRAFT_174364 [Sistotremastrum suecicum HHB10207 ss-3]